MKRFTSVFLLALLTISVTHSVVLEDELNQDEGIKAIQIINGLSVIFLDTELQKNAGLETKTLKKINFKPEWVAYGKAISPMPLLTIRNQYLTAVAQQTVDHARYSEAEKNIIRLRNLHNNEVISTRKLQKHQTQWQADKAIYNASTYQRQIVINNSLIKWGNTVTQWITQPQSDQLKKLINADSTLIKITLPVDRPLLSTMSRVFIDPMGDRVTAKEASFLTLLPQVDNFSQALQYLFLTESASIKAGMNVTVWIPQSHAIQTGVIIPESSLAWHHGQAFVFIKQDEEHFIHRNIKDPLKVAKGYFVAEQLVEGEDIVVIGTQMLLSHEFRSQIPDEDDD